MKLFFFFKCKDTHYLQFDIKKNNTHTSTSKLRLKKLKDFSHAILLHPRRKDTYLVIFFEKKTLFLRKSSYFCNLTW